MSRYFEPAGSVETRYRDVPFDSVKGCFTPADEEDRSRWERECRGQPITIFTPPIPNDFINNGFLYQNGDALLAVGPAPLCSSGCQGPFYGIQGYEGSVCQHLVEIGD
jgi:hypothetical protein